MANKEENAKPAEIVDAQKITRSGVTLSPANALLALVLVIAGVIGILLYSSGQNDNTKAQPLMPRGMYKIDRYDRGGYGDGSQMPRHMYRYNTNQR